MGRGLRALANAVSLGEKGKGFERLLVALPSTPISLVRPHRLSLTRGYAAHKRKGPLPTGEEEAVRASRLNRVGTLRRSFANPTEPTENQFSLDFTSPIERAISASPAGPLILAPRIFSAAAMATSADSAFTS
jgi:hypothetical protein